VSLTLALSYTVGSWLIGFLVGLLLRVVFRSYAEWFS
jgi:hypothetical protein